MMKKKKLNEYDFDAQEKRIIKELIRDPRISDNQITKNTSIPLKTVNRKRNKLEKEELIEYYTSVNNGPKGSKKFMSSELVLIKFKLGISRKHLIDNFSNYLPEIFSKHILCIEIGESSGGLVMALVIESRIHTDILEIINLEIVPILRQRFGEDCVADINTFTLTKSLRILHNYLPGINMQNGKMKPDWADKLIYV